MGSLNEALILTNNALNSAGPTYTTQTISLIGTGAGAKITPTVMWATPASIVYGTPLGGSQLDATTAVGGSFKYTPAAGTVLSAGNTILSATFTPTDTATYDSITTTVVLAVTKAPLTVSATDQSMTYGGTVPTLTGTLSGVVPGDGITASYSTAATSSSVPGPYPITASLKDPNAKLGNYSVTNTPGTLTISKAAAGVQVISSLNPAVAQNSITLTATATSAGGVPTGLVTFLDGTTQLGASTLNTSGVATISTSALTGGSHTITATYAGDTDFNAASSTALTQVVEDFSLAISGGTTGITSVTAKAGSSAVFTFTLSPVGTTTFPATITLAATGLPTGATATLSPATLAAGTGPTTVTLTVQLAQTAANAQHEGPNTAMHQVVAKTGTALGAGSKLPFMTLALLLLPFACGMRQAAKKLGQGLPLLLLLIVGIASAICMGGCGGQSTSTTSTSTPVTYTIHVTGTAGASTHSMDVTLTVD